MLVSVLITRLAIAIRSITLECHISFMVHAAIYNLTLVETVGNAQPPPVPGGSVATINLRTALKTEKVYFLPEGILLIVSRIILTSLYVNVRSTELRLQEMPP